MGRRRLGVSHAAEAEVVPFCACPVESSPVTQIRLPVAHCSVT